MSESLKTADIKYNDLTSEEKQEKQTTYIRKRFGVSLATYSSNRNFWIIDGLNQGQKRNYFYIPNHPEKMEFLSDEKVFVVKSPTGAIQSFKPMNVISLSKEYNNHSLIIPSYTEKEYNFLTNSNFKELTQELIDAGTYVLGKRFGKAKPFYKE